MIETVHSNYSLQVHLAKIDVRVYASAKAVTFLDSLGPNTS